MSVHCDKFVIYLVEYHYEVYFILPLSQRFRLGSQLFGGSETKVSSRKPEGGQTSEKQGTYQPPKQEESSKCQYGTLNKCYTGTSNSQDCPPCEDSKSSEDGQRNRREEYERSSEYLRINR